MMLPNLPSPLSILNAQVAPNTLLVKTVRMAVDKH
jgi:hypothetical protein